MSNHPIVFINIGWMKNYKGPQDDPTLGDHKWLKAHSLGHESWNFAPLRSRFYGYVPREAGVNIAKLNAAEAEKATGVCVVWFAKSPVTGKRVIVGWYRNATIHRSKYQYSLERMKGTEVSYQIEADFAEGKLLPIDQRLFPIPTKGPIRIGQSPIWYGGNDIFRKKVFAYIAAEGIISSQTKKSAKGAPRSTDPVERARIEKAAIDHATRYYESVEGGSRVVTSQESENVGWDLLAVDPLGDTIKVEVKGLSGGTVNAELTSNEYKAMRLQSHREQYVVYVVTAAGTLREKSHVFRYDRETSTSKKPVWRDDAGRKLICTEVVAARLSVK